MSATVKQTSSEQKYQHLYGVEEPVLAVHFMISNQRAARQFFKKKWTDLVPMLEVQIGKLLNSKLSDDDILIRREALSYYLICDQRDADEMKSFCERRAAHIFEHVFNDDPHLQELQISLSAVPVDMKDVADDDALKEAVFAVGDSDGWASVVSRHNYASRKPEQIDHTLVRQIAALRGTCDQFFSAMPKVPEDDETLRTYQQELKKLQQAADIISKGITKLLGNAPDDIPEIAPEPSAPAEQVVEPAPAPFVDQLQLDVEKQIAADAEVVYFPVWNVPKQVIDTYRCGIVRHMPSGLVEVNAGIETRHAAHVVDNLVTRKVTTDLPMFAEPGESCMVIMPLHANTILTEKYFRDISAKLKPLSLMERKQLVLEVIGITDNTTTETIQRLVDTIRPFCSSISFRISGKNRFPNIIKRSGASALGLHVDDFLITTADITQEISQIAVDAEKFKMASFAEGVHTVAVAATAIGAGVALISGEAVGSPLDLPWGTVDFKVESLYTRVISD